MGFQQLNYLIGGKLANGITPASLAYNNVTWGKSNYCKLWCRLRIIK